VYRRVIAPSSASWGRIELVEELVHATAGALDGREDMGHRRSIGVGDDHPDEDAILFFPGPDHEDS
jgi:hypothetical protein